MYIKEFYQSPATIQDEVNIEQFKGKYNTYMGAGKAAGSGVTGGGYLQTMVMTSSPSISRPGWNLTTMLLVNTRSGSWKKAKHSNVNHWLGGGGGEIETCHINRSSACLNRRNSYHRAGGAFSTFPKTCKFLGEYV